PGNNKSSAFNIYPNPSDGSYTMDISADLLRSQIYIYDSMGRLIFQTTLSKSTTTINLPELSSGVYLVKLQTADGQSVDRSIVRK
ncbi:MAG: T9SS type A sorting domain-containing protein, partial [Crocinitomicaceae bacterium]|nr:T9SS type A sorting domain-containing protein [Crocinitomicaceae bacterium]